MGCGIKYLRWLSDGGYLPRKGRMLDVGESYLLAAQPDDIRYLLDRHGAKGAAGKLDRLAERFALRSRLPRDPGVQPLFLSELIELTEVEYVAFDVVTVRKAHRFDLNAHVLAPSKRNTFDLVLNFGTTEHLMNQFNAFRVMHEAARPGGYLFHQLPSTGYVNHGYFAYNPLMFQELAQANGYETVALWYWGQPGAATVAVNPTTYPGEEGAGPDRRNADGSWDVAVPHSLINVLFRKVHDTPFRVGLEVATAAGVVSGRGGFTTDYIDHNADGTMPLADASVILRMPPLWRRLASRIKRLPGVRPLASGIKRLPGIRRLVG